MRVSFTLSPLYPSPDLRVSGTVTDTAGNPLSRRVILYDESGAAVAETWSGADGYASFTITGKNGHNRFVARALGFSGECDDISCPLRGEAV